MGEFSEDITFEITVRIFKGDESRQDIEKLKQTVKKNFQVFFPIVVGNSEAKITKILMKEK